MTLNHSITHSLIGAQSGDGDEGEVTLPGISEGEIVVLRSKRRKKSISAYRQGGRIIISIPARMSKADERSVVPEMIAKIRAQEADESPSETLLMQRAVELLELYAPEITARPKSINWRAMRERWGSCTSVDATIRISDRLKGAPAYALDYVLFHEAIHLHYFDHGPEFKAVLARFPEESRAEAYLEGFEAAERRYMPPAVLPGAAVL
jgi:predicted metal-dependent hydrolase